MWFYGGEFIKGAALTDDDLEKVSGGWNYTPGNPCPYCRSALVYGGTEGGQNYSICPKQNCPNNAVRTNKYYY